MYPIPGGSGYMTRAEQLPPSRFHASVGTPTRGQLVTLKTNNLYYLANNTSSLDANVCGVIVGAHTTAGGVIDLVTVAYCGDEVPLRLFGTLAQLQALGPSHTAFLGSAAGSITPQQEIGVWSRRVFRVPKVFSSLTDEDYQRLWVLLIEETPMQT